MSGPRAAEAPSGAFRSFWMGGFEGADHVNSHGLAVDMHDASGHLARLAEDHARAAALGLGVVRESIGWRLAETAPGRFDFGRLRRIAASARRHGLQVQWTLLHYGIPADLSLLDDRLIERFACFAHAVASELAPLCDAAPVYTLVNEVGFLAWAASQTNLIHPHRGDPDGQGAHTLEAGYALKRRLVGAVLAGHAEVKRADPRARFLHAEPLVHVVAPREQPELDGLAQQVADYQWQVWDMIAGRLEPALGGSPEALDLIGVNFYHSGQWEVLTEQRLWWHLQDPRRKPLSALLRDCWQRYRRPLMLAETSHFGEGRAAWLDDVAAQVQQARAEGTPVEGLCLYPLIDRPDWDDPTHWHHSGLFDAVGAAGPDPLARRPVADYAAVLARWQAALPAPAPSGPASREQVLFTSSPREQVLSASSPREPVLSTSAAGDRAPGPVARPTTPA